MGKKYYYFAASLQMLEFQGKLPLSVEKFLEDCERLLSFEDFKIIEALMDNHPVHTGNSVVNTWIAFEHNFRNSLATERAQKANKDPIHYIRGEFYDDPQILSLIRTAMNASDPLEGEKIISLARWNLLDELANGQFYNFEFIITYGLKLKILERYHTIESPKGKEIYEELKKIDFPEGVASK